MPSTLHQCFKYLQSGIKKVNADLKPFAETEAHFTDAKFYVEDDIPNEVLPIEIPSMESKQVKRSMLDSSLEKISLPQRKVQNVGMIILVNLPVIQ